MTTRQRDKWEMKTLTKVRTNLRKNLAILQCKTHSERDEIETQVMTKIQDAVARVSDYKIEENSNLISHFESDADSLALDILQEQAMEWNWGWRY